MKFLLSVLILIFGLGLPDDVKASDNNYMFCIIHDPSSDRNANNNRWVFFYAQKNQDRCEASYHSQVYSNDFHLYKLLDKWYRKAKKLYKYKKVGSENLLRLFFKKGDKTESIIRAIRTRSQTSNNEYKKKLKKENIEIFTINSLGEAEISGRFRNDVEPTKSCAFARKNSINNAFSEIIDHNNYLSTALINTIVNEKVVSQRTRFREEGAHVTYYSKCFITIQFDINLTALKKLYKIKSNNNEFIAEEKRKIEEEKRRVEIEKKRIEEEKRKIAEQKKKNKQNKVSDKLYPAGSGSGFFVTESGYLISNHHVIDGCGATTISFMGDTIEAKVIAVDKVNDMAILKTRINPKDIFPVSNEDVFLLEDVVVAGYPLGKELSSSIKTHRGVVTALSGLGDNFSEFQTDATINQGNSGGPVVNQKGNVVGVAVKLLPASAGQNIFFAIKSSTLKQFALSNNLNFQTPNNKELTNKELGKLITDATVFIECWMTLAKIEEEIAKENNRKAFYEKYKNKY